MIKNCIMKNFPDMGGFLHGRELFQQSIHYNREMVRDIFRTPLSIQYMVPCYGNWTMAEDVIYPFSVLIRF